MLRETVKGWTREWLEEGKKEGLKEGLKEGRKEGRQEGRREGEVRLLVRMLELKFGPLSPRDRKRIDATDSDRLLEWSDRIFRPKRSPTPRIISPPNESSATTSNCCRSAASPKRSSVRSAMVN